MGPRLGALDVFEIVTAGSRDGRGVFQAIAYVDASAGENLMEFAENVATNRGIAVRVFPSVADAAKWLRAQAVEAGEPAESPAGNLPSGGAG